MQFVKNYIAQVSKSDDLIRQLRGELASVKEDHSRSVHDVSSYLPLVIYLYKYRFPPLVLNLYF